MAAIPFAVLLLAGCPRERPAVPADEAEDASAPPRASVALKVLVVNDAELAEAINRLRGEWTERSGGTLEAVSRPWAEVAAAEKIEADVVVFPTRYLGELSTRGWLRPVRDNVLESETFDAADIFPLVRHELIRWSGQVMALPMGIDLPVMSYRADIFRREQVEPYGRRYERPPETWSEYIEFVRADEAAYTPERPVGRVPPIWEPIESWAVPLFLARVAPQIVHHDHIGLLFDPKTMSPRITEPPFVRALENLRDVVNSNYITSRRAPSTEDERKLLDPQAATCELAGMKARIMAIGLPPAGHRDILTKHERGFLDGFDHIAWIQIPGVNEVYDATTRSWETQTGIHRVPLIGIGDRLIGVTVASRNAASAFKLAAWLASPQISSQLARAGDGTMPVRRSLASAAAWYDPKLTASERSDLGMALEAALDGQDFLIIPRIPGVDEYLAALDEAVKDAVAGRADPKAALQQAAAKWDAITDRLGREPQRQAYLKHLGISEP